MEYLLFGSYALMVLFVLFLIIKKAVSTGIDSSMEIKMLKHEIRDLKKQLKEEQKQEMRKEESNHYINRKI